MMLNLAVAEYTIRCISAGKLLPRITSCSECGVEFDSCFAAEESHGVLRFTNTSFSIIIGCEGYHQIQF
jgi:hypothetical protein